MSVFGYATVLPSWKFWKVEAGRLEKDLRSEEIDGGFYLCLGRIYVAMGWRRKF